MKADYSTAEGQKRLMRESIGQPTEFGTKNKIPVSGFTPGQQLEHTDFNLRHHLTDVTYLRDEVPEFGLPVILVKHRSGVSGAWLARDFRAKQPT